MKLKQIDIQNFKNWSEQTLQFDSQFTLIIGDNGVGKTALLEAITVGLGGFLSGIEGVHAKSVTLDEVRKKQRRVGDATITTEPQFPCVVRCRAEIDEGEIKWERGLEREKGRMTRTQAKAMIHYASHLQYLATQTDEAVILPLLSYQSAGRLFSQKKEKWIDPFERQQLSRFIGYTDCLEAESNIKLFGNWLRRMTLIQLQQQRYIGELAAVTGAIEQFMRSLAVDEDVKITYDLELEEVVATFGAQKLPLRLMSSGYRSVIGMVADLAFRMAILNPHLREAAVRQTPGIVLIDELDLHLHPKWQWNIIQDLKQTFPKVQFIATTHAPIIISSCKDGQVIRLGEALDREDTPYGWLVEDVLMQFMDTSQRLPEIEAKIETVRRLYSKKLRDELTQQEIEELNEQMNDLIAVLPESDPAIELVKIEALATKLKRGEQRD